jgi:ligand-binding SRPBCC domain-containing protein
VSVGATRLLRREQWFPRPLEEVFAFFADAGNLADITPPWLNFRILTPLPIDMHAGALIDYRIRLWGVPIRWRTEITAWEPPIRFVDRQIQGPYLTWIHEHRFAGSGGGTRMIDEVRYAAPLAPVSEPLFVRPQIERIFDYRAEVMRERFGGPQELP